MKSTWKGRPKSRGFIHMILLYIKLVYHLLLLRPNLVYSLIIYFLLRVFLLSTILRRVSLSENETSQFSIKQWDTTCKQWGLRLRTTTTNVSGRLTTKEPVEGIITAMTLVTSPSSSTIRVIIFRETDSYSLKPFRKSFFVKKKNSLLVPFDYFSNGSFNNFILFTILRVKFR